MEALATKRRRLAGKQPEQPVQPSRKRIIGKLYVHRAVLGVRIGATLAEIRAAYRRCALASHPDKGGSAEKFLAVVRAFEVLSGIGEQAPDTDEGHQGVRHRTGGASSQCCAAKLVCAMLISAPSHTWASVLMALTPVALQTLVGLLQERIPRTPRGAALGSQPAPMAPGAPDSGSLVHRTSSAGARSMDHASGSGIGRNRVGHVVKVSWHCFHMRSSTTIRSLEQALNMHIALIQMRDAAVARLQRRPSPVPLEAQAVAAEAVAAEDAPPLLQSELFEFMRKEPCIPLLFSSEIGQRSHKRKKRVMTPFTSCLDTALRFRRKTSQLLLQPEHPRLRAQIDEWRRAMLAEALKERLVCDQHLRELTAVARAELAQRGLPSRPPAGPGRGGDTADGGKDRHHDAAAPQANPLSAPLLALPADPSSALPASHEKAAIMALESWLPGLQRDTACIALPYLSKGECFRTSACCTAALAASDAEAKTWLRHFVYCRDLFVCRHTRTGRPLICDREQAWRFVSLLKARRLASSILTLDLTNAPMYVLQQPGLPRIISGLPSLRHVVYPASGWDSSNAFKTFKAALPARIFSSSARPSQYL